MGTRPHQSRQRSRSAARRGVLNQDGFALLAYIDWLGDYQPVATTDDESESE
jgi:hypothetical protein